MHLTKLFLASLLIVKLSQFFLFKKKGISVIVSCQDDHLTMRECVESFFSLGDEILVVTNRATKDTFDLAKRLESEYPGKVTHIDAPEAFDLYQNRQAGLEHARYRWVMRCDADYIAYEEGDGDLSVSRLRKTILSVFPLWPVAIMLSKVSLSMGWDQMYEPVDNQTPALKYIPPVYSGKIEPRIYSQNPFLKFKRLGRWEGVPGVRWYRKIFISQPYWFEVTLRTARSLLFRQARTDWRETGDYERYPEIDDYVERVFLPHHYPGLDVESAAELYVNEEVMPHIKPYNEARFYPLPARIRSKQGSECAS